MSKSVTTVSLATLSFYLVDSANPTKRIILNKVRGRKAEKGQDGNESETDFLNIATTILGSLVNNLATSTLWNKVAKITRIESKGRYIKGIVEMGRSGTSQSILDTDTGDTAYKTTLKDAIMQPHYFLLYVPEDHHKGIIILERYRQAGIQTLLIEHLDRELRKDFPRHGIKVDYLTTTDTFNKMLDEARVKEIRLTEHVWSSDRSDNTGGAPEIKGSLAVTYKPHRKSGNEFLDKLKRLGAKELTLGNVLELPEDFMNPDEASFVISRKGRKDRRISFTDVSTNFRSYYDISGDVTIGDNGYPTFESTDKIAVEILNELSQGLYEPRSQD